MLWAKRSISSRATTWPSLAYPLLTAAYVISGKLGLLLAVPPGYATAIFAPAGVATKRVNRLTTKARDFSAKIILSSEKCAVNGR